MAIGVSTEATAIQCGVACCKVAIHELNEAKKALMDGLKQAGSSGWRDSKYYALSGIVEECCDSLSSPVDDLQDCMKNLQDLLKAVQEYEDTNL